MVSRTVGSAGISSKSPARPFSIRIEGIPGAHLLTAGQPPSDELKTEATPSLPKPVKLFVIVPRGTKLDDGQTKLTFIVRDLNDSTETRRETNFRGPNQ